MTMKSIAGQYDRKSTEGKAANIAIALLYPTLPIHIGWGGAGDAICYEIQDAEMAGLNEVLIEALGEIVSDACAQVDEALWEIWCDQDPIDCDGEAEQREFEKMIKKIDDAISDGKGNEIRLGLPGSTRDDPIADCLRDMCPALKALEGRMFDNGLHAVLKWRSVGGAMLHHQFNAHGPTRWEVASAEEISEMVQGSDMTAFEATQNALMEAEALGLTPEMITELMNDWQG